MFQIIPVVLGLLLLVGCNTIDLKKSCQGEWGYMVGDTAYCELLIDAHNVYPYHYKALNSYAYSYEIKEDTFYLYGHQEGYIECSPIKYLGKNSFQIMGITPAVLHRLPASKYSLATYYTSLQKLYQDKSMVELYEQGAFSEAEELKQAFERDFKKRRSSALFHSKPSKQK